MVTNCCMGVADVPESSKSGCVGALEDDGREWLGGVGFGEKGVGLEENVDPEGGNARMHFGKLFEQSSP